MGQLFFDQYSILHFAAGIIAYFWGLNFSTWFALNVLYEFIENTEMGMKFINKIKMWPGGKYKSDSIINSAGDVLSASLGWYLAYKLDEFGDKKGWLQKKN